MRKAITRFLQKLGVVRLLGKLNLVNPASLVYGVLKKEGWAAIFRNTKYFFTGFKHNNLPIPPFQMRFYVAGTFDIDWFMSIGRTAADTIVGALKENNLEIDRFDNILDFGCGCGRVARYWGDLKHARVFGSDYNSNLVSWCNNNLKFGTFKVNKLDPPLPFDSEQFDFIYALSVFTHLQENSQHAWMEELTRVLKPNGYCLITTHGESYLDVLNQEDQQRFMNSGFVVTNKEVSGTNYCNTYNSFDFVKKKLAMNFSIVSFIPEGARGNPHQDLYLLKKCNPGQSTLETAGEKHADQYDALQASNLERIEG